MAQQALGPGTVLPRRRALFGLLDADGWALGVGQGVRLARHHHPHARLPARPGLLPDGRADRRPRRPRLVADQPLPADQRDRCPARRRSGRSIPWETSPPELNLPQPRTDGAVLQVGTQILYIGGTDGTTAQSTVYVAKTVGTGNFDKWAEGPPLPEPRADASVAYVAGSIYVIGGRDASRRPDDDGLRAQPGQPDRRTRRVDDGRRPGAARGPQRDRRRRSRRTACC